MKNVFFFSLLFFISMALTAQTEIDSIVIVETEVFNLDTFDCGQWATYRYELDKKYRNERSLAEKLALNMSENVSPCYYYRVDVKINKRLDDKLWVENDCEISGMGCSVYAQDYTFYIIKEKANLLYAQKTSGSVICDYDIKNLPDNR